MIKVISSPLSSHINVSYAEYCYYLFPELDAKTKEEELQGNIAEMKENLASLQDKFSKEELRKLVTHLSLRNLSRSEYFVKLYWL